MRAFVFVDGNNFYFKLKELSDTDLVAAVEEVKSFGKKVQYVGIEKGQSFGLTKVCDDVRLLRPEDIKDFLPLKLL